MNFEHVGQILSTWAVPLIVAITLHEAAHAWVAEKLGDDTARRLGRVTFNPVKHVDLFGTIIMPALLLFFSGGRVFFGYAKPVPVQFDRLNNPKRDMVWVALAGPGINIALAFVTALLMHPFGELQANKFTLWLWANMHNFVSANVLLAVFNMMPILPLDGGRVLAGLLPDGLSRRFARSEPYGFIILLLLIFVVPAAAQELGSDIDPLTAVLLPAKQAVQTFVAALAGWS